MSSQVLEHGSKSIHYLGASLEAGALPAFFYFALSAQESLTLHPYNQPATALASDHLRVFSFTIPGHEEGMNKFRALQYWADEMASGNYPLEDFFDTTIQSIRWLIEEGLVDPAHIAMGGLSRGGFIATHLAARLPQTHTLLGFAPLTDLLQLAEFTANPELHRRADDLKLERLVEQLTHVKRLRFYIGNVDKRVGTDACYHFVRRLAEKRQEKQARHQHIEMMMTQSIGQHGHGTDPHIFQEGSLWAKQFLTRSGI